MFTFDEIASFSSTLTFTKRNILKITNLFFDPLGFLCPIVLQAKPVFNKAYFKNSLGPWSARINWKKKKKRKLFLNFFKNLNGISFDRHLFPDQNNFVWIELYGYCDASKTAYSAVIYARTTYKNKMTIKFC